MSEPVTSEHLHEGLHYDTEGTAKFHALASIFPLLDGDEFDADIRAHGLRQRIVLHESAILDGRNPYRACIEADIEPRFEQFSGRDPLAFVLSLNLRRRHLNESQRVAAKLANMRQGERTDLEPSANLPKVSQSDAAKLLNVSGRSVRSAKAVCDQAVPELIKKVEQGEISVSKAANDVRNKQTEDAEKQYTNAGLAKRISLTSDHPLIWEIKAALRHLDTAVQEVKKLKPKMSEVEMYAVCDAFIDACELAYSGATVVKLKEKSTK
jgi:hypothetical protein